MIHAAGEWADLADAILLTYLPGQEGAYPLAEILTGRVSPGGHLAQSWPSKNADTPVSCSDEIMNISHRGVRENGKLRVRYAEGIFFGYRWYDRHDVKPLFPFGHGLTYTKFEYSALRIDPDGRGFKVQFKVKNIGNYTADEVAQVYIGKAAVPAYIQSAKKQLCGFSRIKNLKPGQMRDISVTVNERSLCVWDSAMRTVQRNDLTLDKWRRIPGRREIFIGSSSEDIRLSGEIMVEL